MRADRLPVVVGVAQWIGRGADAALDPLDVLGELACAAADDARAGRALLGAVDHLGLVSVAGWAPANAPRLLAERLGARPSHEVVSGTGGEIPLRLVNAAAERIGSTSAGWRTPPSTRSRRPPASRAAPSTGTSRTRPTSSRR